MCNKDNSVQKNDYIYPYHDCVLIVCAPILMLKKVEGKPHVCTCVSRLRLKRPDHTHEQYSAYEGFSSKL